MSWHKYHPLSLVTGVSILFISITQALYADDSVNQVINAKAIDETAINTNESQETLIYVVPESISLYQLALQNNMTVEALKAINLGNLDNVETLEAQASIRLPKNAPVFANTASVEVTEITTLPELSTKGTPTPTTAQVIIQQTPINGYVAGETDENVAAVAQTAATQNWNNFTTEQIKDDAENWAQGVVKQAIMEPIQKTANEFLGRFGKGSVNISIDEKGNLEGSSLSVLSPLYDNDESLIFSQIGIHDQDGGDRTIGNFGIGYRYEQEDYLVGANAFIDHDFSGENTRLGLGTEFWMDYVKFAGNYYTPLSNWKESDIVLDYEERPAEGFDIRAQGYLPSYPQIGGSLKYEQYFGNDVALFGNSEDSRQKDPNAIAIGLDYTPIPLLTLKAEQRFGKGGEQDTRFDLNLNLQLGTPIEKQLDPANVAVMRTLKGSRYDLVDRNYDIVFEYRQKAFEVNFNLPTPYAMEIGETLPLQLITSSKTPVTSVKWTIKTKLGSDVLDGFSQQDFTNNDLVLNFKPRDIDTYIITATVTNEAGITVTTAPFVLNMKMDGGSLQSARIANDGPQKISAKTVNQVAFAVASYPDSEKVMLSVKAVQFDETGTKQRTIRIPNGKWWIQVSKGNEIFIDTNNPDLQWGDLNTVALVANDQTAESDPINKIQYHLVSATNYGRDPLTVKIGYGVEGDYIMAQERKIYFHGEFNPDDFALKLFNRGVSGENAKREIMAGENLSTDTYYEVAVFDKQTGKDVTAEFSEGIKWHYFDGSNTINMEACMAYTMFSTQRTNLDNNEFSWGQLLNDPIQTEQGLQLRPSIDLSNWNPEGKLNFTKGAERGLVGTDYHGNVYCPDAGQAVGADSKYIGFQLVAAVLNSR